MIGYCDQCKRETPFELCGCGDCEGGELPLLKCSVCWATFEVLPLSPKKENAR